MFSVYSVCFSVYLSRLYLVDVSQMAIFVGTELIILLFMGVVTFSCCIVLVQNHSPGIRCGILNLIVQSLFLLKLYIYISHCPV